MGGFVSAWFCVEPQVGSFKGAVVSRVASFTVACLFKGV